MTAIALQSVLTDVIFLEDIEQSVYLPRKASYIHVKSLWVDSICQIITDVLQVNHVSNIAYHAISKKYDILIPISSDDIFTSFFLDNQKNYHLKFLLNSLYAIRFISFWISSGDIFTSVFPTISKISLSRIPSKSSLRNPSS